MVRRARGVARGGLGGYLPLHHFSLPPPSIVNVLLIIPIKDTLNTIHQVKSYSISSIEYSASAYTTDG